MNEINNSFYSTPIPLGGAGGRLRIGVLGAAGYTGGELIRLLLNHPQAEIVFANSESNAGNLVSDVHEGLIGETDLKFTDEMPFDKVDVIFFCFGHGKSEQFLKEHEIHQQGGRNDSELTEQKREQIKALVEKMKREGRPIDLATAVFC